MYEGNIYLSFVAGDGILFLLYESLWTPSFLRFVLIHIILL
jgi:hypothetical protein